MSTLSVKPESGVRLPNDKGRGKAVEQLEMEQFKTKGKQAYVKLLDLLVRVNAAFYVPSISDAGERERLICAHNLANKFIFQASTILHLSHGTVIQDLPSLNKLNFLDSTSIDVLTRVLLEAFLVFHYVFYAPTTKEDKEDKDYRYWAYKVGIAGRRKAAEKEELDKIREMLKSNKVFQNLSVKQQKQTLKGEGRLPSWRMIAIDAGFSEMLTSEIYWFLSGSVHSSFLSVAQSVEIQTKGEQEDTISTSMITMNPVIANMIHEYCGLFPKAQEVLSKDREGSYIVDWWIQVNRNVDDITSKAQKND
jgi:hypothetical protein